MRTRTFPLVAFLLLAYTGLVSSCGGSEHSSVSPVPRAEPRPRPQGNISDFILKDVDGRTHALSDYLGENVIVLSFWATWCEPCKKELKKLEELYTTLKDDGLAILAISMDEPETQGDVRPLVKQRGYTFPVLLDTESAVTNQFNPRRAAPYNLIIDRLQQIVWTHEGYVPGDEKKLEHAILTALGKVPE
jgi:peroxiredoxin